MGAARVTLVAAVVAHVLGWALPAVYNERGWRAFRAALSPLWPYEGIHLDPGLRLVLAVASGLTNVLFVVLAAALLLRGAHTKPVLWAAAAATLLNLHWPITMSAERRLLEIGYFFWVSSFALLALAAYLQNASRPAGSPRARARG